MLRLEGATSDVLIFSKDRACQLDALLRSIVTNGPDYSSIACLCAWSSDKHRRAYQQLAMSDAGRGKAFRRREFYIEDHFGPQVRHWLAERLGYVSFLVDDQLFYRPATLPPIPGLVYQYGLNTTRSHPMGCDSEPHVCELREEEGWFGWTWRDSKGDFGYPASIGGNVWDKRELYELLPEGFDSPTSLEAQMASRAAAWSRDTLCAPLHSCLVSLPLNRVTMQATNPIYVDDQWTVDKLCDMFLGGWRIDFQAMDFSAVDAAHAEVPLVFSKQVEGG